MTRNECFYRLETAVSFPLSDESCTRDRNTLMLVYRFRLLYHLIHRYKLLKYFACNTLFKLKVDDLNKVQKDRMLNILSSTLKKRLKGMNQGLS